MKPPAHDEAARAQEARRVRAGLVGGAPWTLGAQALKQVLQLAVTIALARLLAPEAFGHVGLVLVPAGLAALVADLGLGAALVQAPRLDRAEREAAQRRTLLAGAGLGLLVGLSGPLLARLLAEPALAALAPWMGLHVALAASAAVPHAVLSRALRLRAVAAVECLALALGGAAGVAAALALGDARALAVQLVTSAGVTSLGFHVAAGVAPPRLRLRAVIHSDEATGRRAALLRFGRFLTGHRLLEFAVRHADKLLIGGVLGAGALGLYQRAYALMLLPVTQVGEAAGRILFPALARLRGDPARSRALYLRCVRAIALFTFPAMAGLFVVAEELLRVVFGEPWVGAAPALRVLCGVGLMQSVGTTAGWIWRAHGRSDAQLRFGVVAALSALLAYAVGVRWGILGVAVAYALRNVALTWFNFALPGRLIGLRYRDVFGACAGTLACALAMALGLMALDAGVLAGPPSLPHLLARIAVGAALYGALVLAFRLRAARELLALLADAAAPAGRARPAPPWPVRALASAVLRRFRTAP